MITKAVVHIKLCYNYLTRILKTRDMLNTVKNFLKEKMKTIPDLILDIRWYYKRIIDVPLSWMESIGSKMNGYAWRKRWRNREEGTGYGKRPE